MFPADSVALTCWTELPFRVPVPATERWTFNVDTAGLGQGSPAGSVETQVEFVHVDTDLPPLHQQPAVAVAEHAGVDYDALGAKLATRSVSVAVVEVASVHALADPSLLGPVVIEVVNRVIRPLMVYRRRELLRPIGRGDLGPASPVVHYDAHGASIDCGLILNANTGSNSQVAADDALDRKVWNLASRWLSEGDALTLGSYWRSRAATSVGLGQNDDAVIQLAIGVEQLVYELDQAVGRADGVTDEKLARRRSGKLSAAMNRLQHALGGPWDRERKGTAVGDYWQTVKMRRDRIAHDGDHASPAEAQEALQATNRFLLFLIDRILARKQQLPDELTQYVEDPQVVEWVRGSHEA